MIGLRGDELLLWACGRSLREFLCKAACVGATLGAAMSAQAQGLPPPPSPTPTCAGNAFVIADGGFGGSSGIGPALSGAVGAGGALISGINTANTALLTQSTAFVSAPPNAKPNSEGGGVWARGVGGEVNFKSNSTIGFNLNPTGGIPVNGSNGCAATFHQDFIGFQLGQDIAKLDYNGWNLHLGQTAGYVETHGNSNGTGVPLSTETRVPFVGSYAVATNGGFFADALFRLNWYETSLNGPTINLNEQKLDAHGVSVAASAGYRYDVPNANWFWEPSLGIVWSRTTIDPLNVASLGTGLVSVVNGTVQFNTLDSFVGRLGLRFGTTAQYGNVVYQPFVALSVWHEFDSNATANYTAIGLAAPSTATNNVPNIGTYGQYSLGVSGQVVNTGWLGFARVDYRSGNRLEGWSETGGIRYQYTPGSGPMDMAFAMVDAVDHAMAYAKVTKTAPVFVSKAKPMVERPYDWTGWYVGAFGGADYGYSHMGFVAPTGPFASGPQIAGALLGGTLGYNSQVGSWVWGIEGDAGWTNASGSVACAGPVAIGQPLFNTDCRDKADWIATLAGRLGLAFGRTLYYAKAGAAWANESYSVVCNQPPGNICVNPAGAPLAAISVGDTRTGWTAGFGTEFGLTERWSAKGEVSFIGFGRKNLTAADGTVINAGMNITEGKIGVNYRLSP
jgi:outer membrane autotransporter protein